MGWWQSDYAPVVETGVRGFDPHPPQLLAINEASRLTPTTFGRG